MVSSFVDSVLIQNYLELFPIVDKLRLHIVSVIGVSWVRV